MSVYDFAGLVDRYLQADSDPLSPGSNSTQNGSDDGGRDAYEFVAFLLWYIFLVLCCIIPTCCAYRRRRLIEARIAQHQAGLARLQPSNIFFLSSLQSRREGEEVQAERTQLLHEKLKATTMTIQESDLDSKPAEQHSEEWTRGRVIAMHEQISDDDKEQAPKDGSNRGGLDYEVDDEEYTAVLRLSSEKPNGGRIVPGVCAICLCEYEPDDEISWSPEPLCQHAFHKDCIISWLAKKDEAKCPVCRQDFCHLPASEEETITAEPIPFAFPQSFVQTLAMSRLEVNSNAVAVRDGRDASPPDEENGLQEVPLDDNEASRRSHDREAAVSNERLSLEVEQGSGEGRV